MNLEARQINCLHRKPCIEGMLMQTAIFGIFLAAGLESFNAFNPRIQIKIMKFQNFREVRQIVLCRFSLKILNQMIKRGCRATMIERPLFMGHHQQERPARLEHTHPLRQGEKRIGCVLKHMRGKNKIIRIRLPLNQIPSFRNILAARGAIFIEKKGSSLGNNSLPGRFIVEIEVIDARRYLIGGKQASPSKDQARTTDFHSDPTLEICQVFPVTTQSAGYDFVHGATHQAAQPFRPEFAFY